MVCAVVDSENAKKREWGVSGHNALTALDIIWRAARDEKLDLHGEDQAVADNYATYRCAIDAGHGDLVASVFRAAALWMHKE